MKCKLCKSKIKGRGCIYGKEIFCNSSCMSQYIIKIVHEKGKKSDKHSYNGRLGALEG